MFVKYEKPYAHNKYIMYMIQWKIKDRRLGHGFFLQNLSRFFLLFSKSDSPKKKQGNIYK